MPTDAKTYLKDRYARHKAAAAIRTLELPRSEVALTATVPETESVRTYALVADRDGRMRAAFADAAEPGRQPESAVGIDHIFTSGERLDVRNAVALFGLDGNPPQLARKLAVAFVEGLENRDIAARTSEPEMAKLESRRLEKAGLQRFRDAFDPDALAALNCVNTPDWSQYSFYASSPGADRRKEAAAVFPLLAGVIAKRPGLREAVDEGRPLKPALQTKFGLPKGHQKRLLRAQFDDGGVSGEALARTLASVPADWVPNDALQWSAFRDAAEPAYRKLALGLGLDPADVFKGSAGDWNRWRRALAHAITDKRPPEDLANAERDDKEEAPLNRLLNARDWNSVGSLPREQAIRRVTELAEGLEFPDAHAREGFERWIANRLAPDASRVRIENACADVADMVGAFASKVVLPIAAHEAWSRTADEPVLTEETRKRAYDAARSMLLEKKAATAILEASQRWHANQEAILGAAAPDGPETPEGGWPPLTETWRDPETGVWIVPLTTDAAIREEGSKKRDANGVPGLNNCVSGYGTACMDGRSHVVSVRQTERDGSYKRLSVAELKNPQDGPPRAEVVQHRAWDNANPSDTANRAFQNYLNAIASGHLALNLENIEQHRHDMAKSLAGADPVRKACRYDWGDPDNLAASLDAWRDFLDRRTRKMDIAELADRKEIRDIADRMSDTPDAAPRAA